MIVSFLTYTTLFVWARGNISVSPTHWWKFRVHKDKDVVQDIDPDGRKKRSIGMIVSVISPSLFLFGSDIVTQIPPRIRCDHHPTQWGPFENGLWQHYTPPAHRDFHSRIHLQSLRRSQRYSVPLYPFRTFAAPQCVQQSEQVRSSTRYPVG